MGLDASDLIEGLLDEQARRNSIFIDQPDADVVIEDLIAVPVPPNLETVGMQPDGLATSTTVPPHNWDDGQTAWGFFSWA